MAKEKRHDAQICDSEHDGYLSRRFAANAIGFRHSHGCQATDKDSNARRSHTYNRPNINLRARYRWRVADERHTNPDPIQPAIPDLRCELVWI